MRIFLEKEDKTINFDLNDKKNIKLIDILKELKISVDSVILVKNDEICLEDEFVSKKDEIKILSVVSGG